MITSSVLLMGPYEDQHQLVSLFDLSRAIPDDRVFSSCMMMTSDHVVLFQLEPSIERK